MAEPAPHYVPHFTLLDVVGVDVFTNMKKFRHELTHNFTATVDVETSEDEHQETARPETNDPGGELPPGVTPVDQGEPDAKFI